MKAPCIEQIFIRIESSVQNPYTTQFKDTDISRLAVLETFGAKSSYESVVATPPLSTGLSK